MKAYRNLKFLCGVEVNAFYILDNLLFVTINSTMLAIIIDATAAIIASNIAGVNFTGKFANSKKEFTVGYRFQDPVPSSPNTTNPAAIARAGNELSEEDEGRGGGGEDKEEGKVEGGGEGEEESKFTIEKKLQQEEAKEDEKDDKEEKEEKDEKDEKEEKVESAIKKEENEDNKNAEGSRAPSVPLYSYELDNGRFHIDHSDAMYPICSATNSFSHSYRRRGGSRRNDSGSSKYQKQIDRHHYQPNYSYSFSQADEMSKKTLARQATATFYGFRDRQEAFRAAQREVFDIVS